jgi:replicative DNA helicase
VSLRRRQLRILRGIERDLAGSDPGLDALFLAFGRRTRGLDLRSVERIDRRPMLARLRRKQAVTEQAADRCAENRDDQ